MVTSMGFVMQLATLCVLGVGPASGVTEYHHSLPTKVQERFDFGSSELVSSVMNGIGVLQKSVWSDSGRVMFVMGLGGSGHHAWSSSVERAGDIQAVAPKSLIKDVWWQNKTTANEIELYSKIFRLVDKSHSSRHGRTVRNFMTAINCVGQQYLSYPGLRSGGKGGLGFPAIVPIIDQAQTHGYDFRLVVMTRDPIAVLRSTSLNRGFDGGIANMATHIQRWSISAAAMATQLSLLDPAFFMCVQYENFHASADRIAHFLYGGMTNTFKHPNIKNPKSGEDRLRRAIREAVYANTTLSEDDRTEFFDTYLTDFVPQVRQMFMFASRINRLCQRSQTVRNYVRDE